uniref:Uncharacterized protein n=1 Tax=Oryza brachyantha TaxID=4533 RepID=J3NAN4_ORYBR
MSLLLSFSCLDFSCACSIGTTEQSLFPHPFLLVIALNLALTIDCGTQQNQLGGN